MRGSSRLNNLLYSRDRDRDVTESEYIVGITCESINNTASQSKQVDISVRVRTDEIRVECPILHNTFVSLAKEKQPLVVGYERNLPRDLTDVKVRATIARKNVRDMTITMQINGIKREIYDFILCSLLPV